MLGDYNEQWLLSHFVCPVGTNTNKKLTSHTHCHISPMLGHPLDDNRPFCDTLFGL